VGGEPRFTYELAEHFRFIHIALAAYRVSGQGRYLEWAQRYGRCRAERILVAADGPLPVLWDLSGRGLQPDQLKTREEHAMAASSHHMPGDPLSGIKNMLASGAVQALGDLFLLCGDMIFQQAARALVNPLLAGLLDPYGDPAAAAVSDYRLAFNDTSLDQQITAILVDRMPPPSADPWAMVFPQQHCRREPGVGRRNDMIYWGEWSDDGSVKPTCEPSTAALTLAY
jgi:hypothetical protein